jgi:hypothetical protein
MHKPVIAFYNDRAWGQIWQDEKDEYSLFSRLLFHRQVKNPVPCSSMATLAVAMWTNTTFEKPWVKVPVN